MFLEQSMGDSIMNEIQQSPRTLTGGQAVHYDIHTKSLVDWVQVTFKGKKTWAEILTLLGLEKVEFTMFPTGYYGYKNMFGMGNISIMYQDSMDEYHVQMTGQGCRMYEQVSSITWEHLFFHIVDDPEAHMTRLDLAIDDFKGIFTIPTIRRKMKRGELVTKFKGGNHTEEFRFTSEVIGNSPVTGDGVRFGSPTSRLMIRMYDKLKERENQGYEVTVDKWVRTELQLRKEYANEAVLSLCKSYTNETGFQLGKVAKGYLKEYLRFVDPSTDSNKRRWKESNFWKVYMKNIEPLSLSLEAPDKTIERSIEWLDHAISPSLAAIYKAKGESFFNRFIDGMKKEGSERMKTKHNAMVNEHLEKEKITREINKHRMNEVKRKMATIRENRSQNKRMKLKHETNVYMNYITNNTNKTIEELPSVLEPKQPRIKYLDKNE